MSNLSGDGDGGSFSSANTGEQVRQQEYQNHSHGSNSGATTTWSSDSISQQQPIKKKRNLPGNPDPSAEVIALSPTTLMATNRFLCEICNKGFKRDQNLQLHRRGHNLPWKLKQRASSEMMKKVYICPVTTCVHHNPSRALGDLTGIKKHFCRKHGEKKWKCERCSKKYAVQSDCKAHMKTCGTKEYKCDCGTIFSRRDSFITHRAFCDALTEENNKANEGLMSAPEGNIQGHASELISSISINNNPSNLSFVDFNFNKDDSNKPKLPSLNMEGVMSSSSSNMLFGSQSLCSLSFDGPIDNKSSPQMARAAHLSATAMLQKAAQMGATASGNAGFVMKQPSFGSGVEGSYGEYDGGFSNQFMSMYSTEALGIFMGSDQDHDLLRNEHLGVGGSRYRGSTSGDVTTVDFMGVGGTGAVNLHEQQQHQNQQQQGLDFGGVSQQRLHGLHQLQQQFTYGQAEIGKTMWDI